MANKHTESVRLICIESFVHVADKKSYKAASLELNVTPEQVKKNINSLETWLRDRLLYSVVRKPMLTEFGQNFLPTANKVIDLLNSSRAVWINNDNFSEMTQHLTRMFSREMTSSRKFRKD